MAAAARGTFEKLGETRFELSSFTFHNGEGRFVPVSGLNRLRRELMSALEEVLGQRHAETVTRVKAAVVPSTQSSVLSTERPFRWSIRVDRVGFLDALDEGDVAGIDEIVIDIARDHPALLAERLVHWAARVGREHIRLALPPLTRAWEDGGVRHKVERLRSAGWSRWEAANLSAWSYLGLDPTRPATDIDLSTDWSVYVLNRLAARQLLEPTCARCSGSSARRP
jgi:hypothetical protein